MKWILSVLFVPAVLAQHSQAIFNNPTAYNSKDPFADLSLSADDKALLTLHKTLVEAESTSQELEWNAAKVLTQYFDELGWSSLLLPVTTTSSTAGRGAAAVDDGSLHRRRPNVLAWPGSTNHTKLLVSSHIDTVPPYIPYSVRDGSIWGRGSADAKASVAAQLEAIRRSIAGGNIEADDVAVLYVVGEESAGDGMKAFSAVMEQEGRTWETVLFGEPTENKVAVGHKGMVMFTIHSTGKAAHSGYPELGSSANDKLVDLLYDLKSYTWPRDEVLGNTTFNIGRIEGGVAANVVPASASAACSIRVASDLDGILSYLRTRVALTPDTSYDIQQAAIPTKLDSLAHSHFEEIVVK